ncbi:hypothetical protein [Helicobacter acinonychis]|uniref:hypothetical protein n=1 Tax=Helicobacter acinonychis TaxID=212 RepID=UPI00131531DB
MKKTLLLSLASSLLHAEGNGFFVSASYQIGGTTQSVKSAGGLQKLFDAYGNLNNLINQSSSPNAINKCKGQFRLNRQEFAG